MKKISTKNVLLLTMLLAILTCAIGGTIAWITTSTDSIENTFGPSEVTVTVTDNVTGNVKNNVVITNTGNTDAYIRAAIVANWVKDNEIVAPWTDSVSINSGWVKVGNFYYYTSPVAPGNATGTALFTSYTAPEAPVGGAHLEMNILAQAIQSSPANAIQDAGWGWQPN